MSIKGKIAKMALGNVISKLGETAPEIINQMTESAPKLIDQIKNSPVRFKKETKNEKVSEESSEIVVATVDKDARENAVIQNTPSKPQSVWSSIGCSQKTIDFTLLALADGIIDDQEREMLYEMIVKDGVDKQEFDFMLAKALEHFQKMAKNVIKELSGAFDLAEKMAQKEEKANSEELMQALPGLISMTSSLNPFAMASSVSMDVVGKAIGKFVKEPSKLNRFKAEIIRVIDIPLMPEVLADFFSYASSQIIEENQKNESNGLFKRWSENLFGKDIDLVPIWKEKLNHIMDKALVAYGNQPRVMGLFSKWRDSPLKKLMKLDNRDDIIVFPTPTYTTDYIEVLQYSFQKSQESNNSLREAFCILCIKVYNEGQALGEMYPDVSRVLDECRIRPVQELISNCSNADYVALFKAPEDMQELLEVLQYLKSRNDLKQLHKQIYKEALRTYEGDVEALKEIKLYKPKGLFGF